jgi:drug/metabolite transporter (DMT)-like permease
MSIEREIATDPAARHARLFILGAAMLWSLAGVFIKSLALDPLAIVFYRSLFAALFFAPLVRVRSWKFSAPLFVSALSYTAAVSAFVVANKLTSAANAIVLQYTAPIYVFIFARFLFREKSRGLISSRSVPVRSVSRSSTGAAPASATSRASASR